MAFRIERDSLGEKKVPGDAYYGIQTQRAVENFPISGYRAHPVLIKAMGLVKKAAATANHELGLLDERRAGAIVQAAGDVIAGKLNDQFVVDVYQAGAGVSFHMNTNEVIANRAIELLGGKRGDYSVVHPNDHVNFGQSTNDVFPTAMRLAAILLVDQLLPEMERLSRAFARKGQEFDNTLKSGRTHMQDAVPVRLGQEFAAYGVAVLRCYEQLRQAQSSLRELGLGGTAVGTGVNAHPRYQSLVVQRLSELSRQQLTPTKDMRWTMQSNLPLAMTSGALRNYALELIRISNDLRLLSSGPNTGLGEIALPALQPGSSIMPGKINPVIPELVALVGFQVVGNDMATAVAVQAGQLELNVMMPSMAWNLTHSAEILRTTTRQFSAACVEGITANRERCRQYAESTVALATALNPYIGYAKAADLAKQAVRQGRTIPELALSKRLLNEKQLKQILDPRRMTEPAPPVKEARPAAEKRPAASASTTRKRAAARRKKSASRPRRAVSRKARGKKRRR